MKGMKLRMIERGVEMKLGKSEYGVESWFLECNRVLVLSLLEAVFRNSRREVSSKLCKREIQHRRKLTATEVVRSSID